MPTTKFGIIVCGSFEAVDAWIQRLRKIGCNYFVRFRDVRGPALQYGYAAWVETDTHGNLYINR